MVISIKRFRKAFSRSAWVPSRQPGRAGGLPSTPVMGMRGRLGGEVRGDTSARRRVKSGREKWLYFPYPRDGETIVAVPTGVDWGMPLGAQVQRTVGWSMKPSDRERP